MSQIEIYYSNNTADIRTVAIWLSEYSSDKEGRILVSPELATTEEVDFHVDRLIERLNKAREDAKKLIIG